MDMEDGVAPNRKAEARLGIAAALRELDFGRSEKLARLNAVGSGLESEDIQAVLPFRPDGVVLPKTETLEQIQWASEKIEAAELACGWPLGSIRLLVGVETPRAILNLKEIASHPRLDALIFGGEDYAASVGATRTPGCAGTALCPLGSRDGLRGLWAAGHRHGLGRFPGSGGPCAGRPVSGRSLGYTGKQVIHPRQVAPVQAAFTPDRGRHRVCPALGAGFPGAPGPGAWGLCAGWQDDRHAAGQSCRGCPGTRQGSRENKLNLCKKQ